MISDAARAGSRSELADLLRSRRHRLTPADVGLPAGTRRRTAGLRREEVAQLAGVSTTYYTFLEQGRDVRPSRQVVTALAKEAVERVVLAVEVKAAKFQVSRTGGEFGVAKFKHRLADGSSRPHQLHWGIAITLVDDPRGRPAADRWIESCGQFVSAGKEADHGTWLRGCSCPKECFGR